VRNENATKIAQADISSELVTLMFKKTYQFKTHCKGDSHSSKTASIILPGLTIKQKSTSLRLQAK